MKIKNLLVTFTMAFCLLSLGASNVFAQASVNWVQWTAPSSYPLSATWTAMDRPPVTYSYTSSATGTLNLPQGGSVSVTQFGEITNESCFDSVAQCGTYWGMIGGWSGLGTAFFTSPTVPTLPDTDQMLAQVGVSSTNHFTTFSAPVSNVVMNVFSLGSTAVFGGVGVTVSYIFDRDFEIVSQDPQCNMLVRDDFCLWKVGRTLFGREGSGTIQFTGTFSSFSFNASDVESYNGFQIGATSEPLLSPCDLDGAVTRSMGGWSNTSRDTPLTAEWYGTYFPTGLTIGRIGRTMTLSNPTSLRDFLPNGGEPAILPLGNLTDYNRKEYKNALAGQAVAATLNMVLSPGIANATLVGSGSGTPYAGHTVQQILSMANDALGHQTGPLPTKTVLSNLTYALDLINNNYLGGMDGGRLTCEEAEPVVAPGIEAPTTIKAPIFRKR